MKTTNIEVLTIDSSEFSLGDTVTVDNFFGFFRGSLGDVKVSMICTKVKSNKTALKLITSYHRLIPCRIVLTEKIINFSHD